MSDVGDNCAIWLCLISPARFDTQQYSFHAAPQAGAVLFVSYSRDRFVSVRTSHSSSRMSCGAARGLVYAEVLCLCSHWLRFSKNTLCVVVIWQWQSRMLNYEQQNFSVQLKDRRHWTNIHRSDLSFEVNVVSSVSLHSESFLLIRHLEVMLNALIQ